MQAGYGVGGAVSSTLGGAIGDGSFSADSSFAISITGLSIANGDVNGDGLLDLLSVGASGGSIVGSLALGNGDGSFQQETLFALDTGFFVSDVELTDLNNDGILDILSNSGSQVLVALGQGIGSFVTAIQSDSSLGAITALQSKDLNGDGLLDIIAAGPEGFTGAFSVLLGEGNGSFSSSVSYVETIVLTVWTLEI